MSREITRATQSRARNQRERAIRRRFVRFWTYITSTPRVVAAVAAVASLVIAGVFAPIVVIEYQRSVSERTAANAFLDEMAERIATTETAANRYARASNEFGRHLLQLELQRQTSYGEHVDKLITEQELAVNEAKLSEELTLHQLELNDFRAKYEERVSEFHAWRTRAALEAGRWYPQRSTEIFAAFTKAVERVERFNEDLNNRALAFAVAGTLRHHGLRMAALSFRAGKMSEHEFRARLNDAVDVTVAEKKMPRLDLQELHLLVPLLQRESHSAR
jgi:hypothetical protein